MTGLIGGETVSSLISDLTVYEFDENANGDSEEDGEEGGESNEEGQE